MEEKTRAIVIGGGIGGLTAAAVALKHFSSVVLIDKDELLGVHSGNEDPRLTSRRRPGVAQYVQPHVLLAGGAEALDSLLPGFTAELMRRGALKFDAGSGFSIYDFGAKYMRREAGIPLYAASRRLINETLNETLLAHAGDRLTFRDKTKVAGLLWDKQAKGGRCGSKAGTVRGVLLSTGEEVFGDVVIMSDGRRSQLPRWLKEGGVELPQMLKVDCKMNYATRWMRLPEDFDPEKEFYGSLVICRPDAARGGAAYLIEDHCCQVILFGAVGDKAPSDHEGWVDFAATLPDKSVHDLIQRCEPITPVLRFAGVPNLMPQYHKADLPSGLFVMGDAFMALNPVYGQGMTVASMGAVLLDKHLTKALGKRSAKKDAAAARTAIHAAAPRFHKKQHKQNGIAWSMATAEDMRYDGVETVGVPHPPEAIYRYTDGLFKACQKDWKVWKRVLRVAQLLDPPSKMFSPRMLRYGLPAVLWGKKGRKVKPMAQPEKEAAEVESVSSVEEVPAVVSVASDEVSGVEKGVEEVPVMMVQAQAGRPVAVM